jgi:trehalose 6-phosphate phosphatase
MKIQENDSRSEERFKSRELKGIIVDMDGVITKTAIIHKEAWKKMFDRYLETTDIKQQPMSDEDYINYIDGKPRYEGLISFLKSRKIKLPFGNADDSVDEKTICGLANLKNILFLEHIERFGVEAYSSSISQIIYWKSRGVRCAVVSSSKNCRKILEAAKITDLFESRIDGVTMYERGLKGKPAPDMFLEAAKELDLKPDNCAIIEDAISGVQAGSRGNFSLVVGISRAGNKKVLSENGADIVVDDLKQIDFFSEDIRLNFIQFAPSLFLRLSEFNSLIKNKKPVLFLDYDGTLTPIVKNPEDAILSDKMKSVLRRYNSKSPLAIISGRDMDDLKKLVGNKNIIYAGSHGFRISGPGGIKMEHRKSEEILPGLDRIEKKLHALFTGKIKGVYIERKRYAISVHYRNVLKEDIPSVLKEVDLLINQNKGFRKGEGKMVVEIRPDVDWHKGRAIKWILDRLDLSENQDIVPIYIGDDLTDEDVFETLLGNGIGILVGFHGRRTKARYSLKNVYQVQLFIEMLTNNIQLK